MPSSKRTYVRACMYACLCVHGAVQSVSKRGARRMGVISLYLLPALEVVPCRYPTAHVIGTRPPRYLTKG